MRKCGAWRANSAALWLEGIPAGAWLAAHDEALEALPALLSVLQAADQPEQLRLDCLWSLVGCAELDNRCVSDVWLQMLRNSIEPDALRSASSTCLALHGAGDTLDAQIALIDDADTPESVRLSCARALNCLWDSDVANKIEPAFQLLIQDPHTPSSIKSECMKAEFEPPF